MLRVSDGDKPNRVISLHCYREILYRKLIVPDMTRGKGSFQDLLVVAVCKRVAPSDPVKEMPLPLRPGRGPMNDFLL